MTVARGRLIRIVTVLALALGLVPGLALAQGDDGSIPSGGAVGLELVADGLTSPVAMIEAPDGSGRMFIVDQVGLVWIMMPDGSMLDQPFLDVRDRMVELRPGYDERGLLGFAFHPDYAENGRFFVYYSAPPRDGAPADFNHTSHLSEFQVSADNPDMADPDSEQVLLEVDEPQRNHNAGTVAFGPDGYLYLSLGDGGGANDVGTGHVEDWYDGNAGGNAQNTVENLLGKILRLDVDDVPAGQTYGIPADNPLVGTESMPEIWAWGFRNPYRFSFDMGGDNAMWVGDAGQNRWEEVSIAEAGGNYGWNVKEGSHCFDAENPDTDQASCPDEDADGNPLIDPVIEFANVANGGPSNVVVGGYVYRGTALPEFEGDYIFGGWSRDFENPDGTLFVASGPDWETRELKVASNPGLALGHFVLGFAQDLNGEVYVLTTDNPGPDGDTGKIYRLAPPSVNYHGGGTQLTAQLLGANDVPPADPDGFGFAKVIVNADLGVICFRLSVAGIAPATAAHIHEGVRGVNGPVVVPFIAPTEDGMSSGCVTVDTDLAAAILANPQGYYVNVHNAEFPGGAIRGQLSP